MYYEPYRLQNKKNVMLLWMVNSPAEDERESREEGTPDWVHYLVAIHEHLLFSFIWVLPNASSYLLFGL